MMIAVSAQSTPQLLLLRGVKKFNNDSATSTQVGIAGNTTVAVGEPSAEKHVAADKLIADKKVAVGESGDKNMSAGEISADREVPMAQGQQEKLDEVVVDLDDVPETYLSPGWKKKWVQPMMRNLRG